MGRGPALPRRIDPAQGPYVYFMQSGDAGPVKIGWANDPERRRSHLQCGNPVVLVIRRVVPGDAAMELEFHRVFHPFQLWSNREWFMPEPPLERAMQRKDLPVLVADGWVAVRRALGMSTSKTWRGHEAIQRCEVCDADIHGEAQHEVGRLRMCESCAEFAALRASGADPFADVPSVGVR